MNTYGVFFRVQGPRRSPGCACCADRYLDRWALTSNRRRALRWARQTNGVVGVHRNQTRHDVWDAPTFSATMDVVADFRGQP